MEIIRDRMFELKATDSFKETISNQPEISAEAARDLQLKAKSREMEALFITEMFKAMEKTVPEDATGGSNNLPKMLFSSVMGEAVAENGGIGLADPIYMALKDKDEILKLDDLKDNGILTSLSAIPVIPTMEGN